MDQESLSASDAGRLSEELLGALARCDEALGSATPVLRHLVSNSESSLFHEEVLARVRGMLDHLGTQMLRRYLDAAGRRPDERIPLDRLDALVVALANDQALLSHLHSLAIEWRTTQRFTERRSAEMVLTPLIQELVGADERETAQLAMALLTAQARFAQHARRLQVELKELPGDLLNVCLKTMRKVMDNRAQTRRDVQLAIRQMQEEYDEASTRLGLANLIVSSGKIRDAALDPEHAGIPLFATALAQACGLRRDIVVLGIAEGQAPRLGLMLRAAALDQRRVERTVLLVHPEARLPAGLAAIDRHTAADLLSRGSAAGAGR